MGVDKLFVPLLVILTEVYLNNNFFGDGGTNLHKNGTRDIFPAW